MATPRTSGQPRPRTIRGPDTDQRREQLLAAAFELFARDGYANASIEEICQTAYVGNKVFSPERIENQVAQAMQESADADEDELVRRRCPRSRTPWSMTRAPQW
jgi:DNA-binding transcriptional regulator YbjK